MHYSILIHESAELFAQRSDKTGRQVLFGAIGEYLRALREAGVFVAGAGLESPDTATTLACTTAGRWRAQDGPFADTKEQLAGFILINAPDRASALAWAQRCPPLPGRVVELRANLIPPE